MERLSCTIKYLTPVLIIFTKFKNTPNMQSDTSQESALVRVRFRPLPSGTHSRVSCSPISRFSCSLRVLSLQWRNLSRVWNIGSCFCWGTFICKMIFLFIKWHYVYWMSTNIIPRKLYWMFQGCFFPPCLKHWYF